MRRPHSRSGSGGVLVDQRAQNGGGFDIHHAVILLLTEVQLERAHQLAIAFCGIGRRGVVAILGEQFQQLGLRRQPRRQYSCWRCCLVASSYRAPTPA